MDIRKISLSGTPEEIGFQHGRLLAEQIHQNVARKMGGISVKAIIGKSIGTARINGLREEDGLESIKQAYATAKLVPEDKNFVSLPGPKDWIRFREPLIMKRLAVLRICEQRRLRQ